MIEDKIPDKYKRSAYHPSLYIYAWKKGNLEKLFEELMQSNIAILAGEVWLVEGRQVEMIIPLKGGQQEVFHWEIEIKKNEDWFDFVERSAKESTSLIDSWNLEKEVRTDLAANIWYHFKFSDPDLTNEVVEG